MDDSRQWWEIEPSVFHEKKETVFKYDDTQSEMSAEK